MRWWLSPLLVLTACSVRLQPVATLSSIEPATGVQGTPVAVVIRGSGFAAASHVDFSSGSIEVETAFEAWLGDTSLADVRRVDGTTLSATVPSTLVAGTHALSVATPRGARLSLAAAFVVVPRRCTTDADCDDGDACDGLERCEATVCAAGAPLSCPTPSDPCLASTCDAVAGCVTRPSALADADGDGHGSRVCGGDDCDDSTAACGAACHPGAPELCDGRDNDCDPATLDGAGEPLLGEACDGADADLCLDDVWGCSDEALACSAGADNVELISDGVDQDCDGLERCWQDRDGDAFGSATVVSHAAGSCDDTLSGTASRTGDCDDDPAACGAACHPGGVEVCDGWDDDCNPATPDGAADPRLGAACDGPETAACDVWLGCTGGALVCGLAPGHIEGPYGSPTCRDGADNDCDGTADAQGVGSLPPDPKCGSDLPPVVSLVVAPQAAEVHVSFAADAGGTRDDRDALAALRFDWVFGDGATLATAGPTVTHTYGSPGDRRIWVTVTDTGGKAASASFDVVVTSAGGLTTVDSEAALRAALAAAKATPERDTIRVTAATIALSDTLVVDTAVDLVGATTFSAGFAGAAPCLVLLADGIHLAGLSFTGCPTALQLAGGTGTQVERCSFRDNHAVVVWASPGNTFGPDNDVGPNRDRATVGVDATAPGIFDGNHIHDNGSHGISLGAGGSVVERNTIYANGGAGVVVRAGVSGTKVWFNTLDRNADDGLRVEASSGTQVYDNLFTNNVGWALNALPGASMAAGFNDHFPSGRGCGGCTVGPSSVSVSPSYVSPGSGDYRLLPGSPVIDLGLDLGVDANGPLPGLYSGAAPDLGAWESP